MRHRTLTLAARPATTFRGTGVVAQPIVSFREAAGGLIGRLAQAWATLQLWRERHRTRRHLLEIDEHTLKDIGLSRGEVLFEASKPFWR